MARNEGKLIPEPLSETVYEGLNATEDLCTRKQIFPQLSLEIGCSPGADTLIAAPR